MLWSQLAQWPQDKAYPEAVRQHMRVTRLMDSREGDLKGWRFAMEMSLLDLEKQIGPLTPMKQARRDGLRENIAEIDRVLRWMLNTDWPFR